MSDNFIALILMITVVYFAIVIKILFSQIRNNQKKIDELQKYNDQINIFIMDRFRIKYAKKEDYINADKCKKIIDRLKSR